MFGLRVELGFAPVPLTDPTKLRDDLASAASISVVPPLRIVTDVVEIDARPLVVAEIDPLPSDQRPRSATRLCASSERARRSRQPCCATWSPEASRSGLEAGDTPHTHST